MILQTEYDRFTNGYGKDYRNLNNNSGEEYPKATDDGKVNANVILPTWGEMYSGNDLNIIYWYINRWPNSFSVVSYVSSSGDANGTFSGNCWNAIRPVVTLKSDVKIKSGEGTMTKPYSLYM